MAKGRLDVLALRDPCDALDAHRMDREDRSGPERPPQLQSSKRDKEERGACRVHEQVDKVEPERLEACEVVLYPEA